MEKGLTGIKNHPVWHAAENLNQVNHENRPEKKALYNILDQEMSNIGYLLLAHGMNAKIYTHHNRPGEVLKIFYNRGRHADWLRWVSRNQHNPHVPQLRSKLFCIKHKIYAIRIERLEKLSAKIITKHLNPKLLVDKNFLPEAKFECYDCTPLSPLHKKFCSEQNRKWLNKRYPLLVSTWNEAAQFGGDLYGDNIMQRGNTVVFIDP